MSKELQYLKQIKKTLRDKNNGVLTELQQKRLDTIETAFKNYEEGLHHAKTYVKHSSKQALCDLLGLAIKNVSKSYWKLPEQLYEDVNKSLKALEIIKEKGVDVRWLILSSRLVVYNFSASIKLTQKEYDLLKEMLL